MSSRRGLISGSARSASRRTHASRPADDEASLELPPYQPPRCPLNAEGQRMLKELSSSPTIKHLQKATEESAKLLASTVGAINDRMTVRKKAASGVAEREAKRRRANNDDAEAGANSADVEHAQTKARELEEEVVPLAMRVEQAMREVLDLQAVLQDETAALGNLPEVVMATQQDRINHAQRDDDNDPDAELSEVPGVPILQALQAQRDAQTEAYDKLSMYRKYAKNNSYINFKRNWHEGLYNDDVPVPDPRTWFDRDGQPQHVTGTDGDEDDSDADIQIAREKRSFRCPLSLVAMTEPYTCQRCKHSFEKEAIFSYLGITMHNAQGFKKKCPETGCQINDMNKDDLYFDEPLLRRIKRAEQAEREEEEASSDPEGEEEEQEDETVDAEVKGEAAMADDD